jgi:hypothetical protein
LKRFPSHLVHINRLLIFSYRIVVTSRGFEKQPITGVPVGGFLDEAPELGDFFKDIFLLGRSFKCEEPMEIGCGVNLFVLLLFRLASIHTSTKVKYHAKKVVTDPN